MPTIRIPVISGEDDAWVSNLGVSPNIINSDSSLVAGNLLGAGFNGIVAGFIIPISGNLRVIDSYLEMTARNSQSTAGVRTTISLEDMANSTRVTLSVNDYLNRLRTDPVYFDDIEPWSAELKYRSVSFPSLVQRIIDKPGWDSYNRVNVFWEDLLYRSDVGAYRNACAYDYDPGKAMVLVIEYTEELIMAGFSASPTSGMRPLTVSFTDESVGVISSRLWDFGDGSESTEQNPSHTYDIPAGSGVQTFTVTLTASGPDGTDTAQIDITVIEKIAPRRGLYFSEADIPRLQALRTTPSHQAIYNNIKTWADIRVNQAPPDEDISNGAMIQYMGFYIENMTFMYYMTGETQYLEAAKRWLLSLLNWSTWGDAFTGGTWQQILTMCRVTAFGYDALCYALSPEERASLRAMMIDRIGTHCYDEYNSFSDPNWGWAYPATNSEIGGAIGLVGLALKDDWDGAQAWINYGISMVERSLSSIGRDGDCWDGPSYRTWGYDRTFPFIEALQRLEGYSMFSGYHLDQVPNYYNYFNYNGSGLQLEDSYWGLGWLSWEEIDGYKVSRELAFIYLLASKYGDGHAQWFADNYSVKYRILSYIWKNPDIIPVPPDDLPLTKHFRDNGYVIWNTGWGNNRLTAAVKSSNSLGHGHAVQNMFMICNNGTYITGDVGYWLYNDINIARFSNCILVDGQGQTKVEEGAGGQGTILSVEEYRPYYRYLAADGTDPFMGALDEWIRQIVFIEPDYFVISDRVVASSPKQVDWQLQAPFVLGGAGHTPDISLNEDLITLHGSAGDQQLNVRVLEPESFYYERVPYQNDQSLQCYYAKVTPQANQPITLFLNVIFTGPVFNTIKVDVGNAIGAIIQEDANTLTLVLFSKDKNIVDEYVELGGVFESADGRIYNIQDTGVRAQFNNYQVMRLVKTAGPPVSGILAINSNPTGASVYINGTIAGSTPFSTTLDPGTYSVHLHLEGYVDQLFDVTIVSQETTTADVTLEKIPSTASVAPFVVAGVVGVTISAILLSRRKI